VTNFTERAHERLADADRRAALAIMTDRQSDARVVASAELADFDALRDRAAAIRDEAINNLPHYLDELVTKLEGRGVIVHRAATAAEAVAIVSDITARRGGGPVVKGKSMLSEEIGLNERLEADGVEVFETDLGEFILQLAGQPPEHILAPAIHWSRDRVRKLFEPLAGRSLGDDPEELVGFARGHLRGRFESARVGITGVNFGVAETGTIVVVSNEGNGRLSAAMPPVHIALMGIERVVPRLDDLGVLLPLLVRSATGQRMSSYVSMIQGPRRDEELEGPEEMHLVLVDNGRSGLRDSRYASVLRCIRCGACQNVCPVYRQVGGSAYGWVYGGPIGAVLTPLFRGQREAGELSQASSLCAACDDVCPVKIPLHELLLDLRRDRAAEVAGRLERLSFRLWSEVWSRPWAYRASVRLAPLAARLPGPGRRFTRTRDLKVRR
jgi:L-lactate dehydrogenase complex protein LldF